MTEMVGPCILWEGYVNSYGYGRRSVDGRRGVYVHRYVWEQAHGTIPDGMTVDHICRTRACINIKHLRLLTHKENVLIGVGPTALNARKTHCIHGHLFDEANTYWRKCGGRACRRCGARQVAEYSKRKKIPA